MKLLKITVLIILGLLLLFFVTKPLRNSGSEKYVTSGNQLLAEKKYLAAELEYRKAYALNSKNNTANERRKLVSDAQKDVLKLKNFYSENSYWSELELLNKAAKFPADEKQAVVLAKELIEKNEFQLAILPLETAIEMDPSYRDAWLYLGIANLKMAQFGNISGENRNYYQEKSKSALTRTKELDPDYQPTKDYLEELDTIVSSHKS